MVVICPGIHDEALTQGFVLGLQLLLSNSSTPENSENILIFPGKEILALSGLHIVQFLREHLSDRLKSPVIFIGFSAGVVGAIGAAWEWQLLGGNVKALIAIDGWGVPLFGNFPIHRISHDYFTHWSSSLLGSGQDSFYADPPVDHLDLWRSPQTAQGWWVHSFMELPPQRMTAAEFLHMLLERYGNSQ